VDLFETGSEGVHSTELAHDKALYRHTDKYMSSVKAWNFHFDQKNDYWLSKNDLLATNINIKGRLKGNSQTNASV
jgi:hypothetical protein